MYRYFHDLKTVTLILEHLPGGEFFRYLVSKTGGVTEREARKFMVSIGDAVCHMHSHFIVHRDLKLENILMIDENTIKVIFCI